MTTEHVPKGFEKYLHVPVGAQQPHARWFAMYAAGGPTPEAILGDLSKTCVYRTVTNEALDVYQVLISLKNKLRISNIRAAVPGVAFYYVKPNVDWADFLTFMQNKHAPGLVEGSIHATIHQKASPHSSPDMWEPDCAAPKKRKTEHALAGDGGVEGEVPVETKDPPAPPPAQGEGKDLAQGEGKDLYDWVCHFSLTQGRRPFKEEYIKRFINLWVLYGAAPFDRSLEAMNIKNM